ncbi:MAG TPA: potassium-transporting ATPase subunit KdpA [Acidimicrobiales bacterium]|jgi:K+-transporting ATPase ATPase A chain|nr:potassium-transporting ATPase subunit KdpA [Acidimicrobiales bacterium]
MTTAGWLELAVLIAAIAVTTPLLGGYMAKVYDPSLGRPRGDRLFSAIERPIFRLCRIDPAGEQRWSTYALSLLAFSLVSVLVLYGQMRLQGHLLLNPDHYTGVDPKLSFNTAVSFLTNTNWQAYGDGVMSQLTQMTGLAFHNFVSAAAGASVAVAFIRGLVRRKTHTLGNFWVDLVRTCVRVLLPLAFLAAIVLMSQGVVDNFHASRPVTTVAGQTQVIPGGPVASQEAIKEGGQNGGGYFGTNSAHPFENPNGISDLVELWLILAIPFAFTFTFGKMARDQKQGWVVFAAMFVLWLGMLLIITPLEARGSPKLAAGGANQQTTALQAGGNMEGKETRFGPVTCGYFAASTTSTSDGAVNCAHDSLTPLGGGTVLVNMMYGEVSPGGTGSGLFGMLIFALLAVFIAGLMVGRTPEYLGKKIQAPEMKLVVLYLLLPAIFILAFAAAAVVIPTALHARLNGGPHGLTEIVYAYTEAFNNNGSAFAGLSANTIWYDTTLGIVMLVGRFVPMILVLAIGGSLGRKNVVPATAGTFPTGTPLFGALLGGVVVIVVGLTYFPVVALGPVVEHLAGHF